MFYLCSDVNRGAATVEHNITGSLLQLGNIVLMVASSLAVPIRDLLSGDTVENGLVCVLMLLGNSTIPRIDLIKVRNFYDVMGYIGYVSGNEADRRKLYITDMKPLVRRRDGEQFAYSVFTKSIGSGKESRFTLFNREFKKEPVKVGDIIYCKGYQRDGEYFKLTAYDKVL